ncbi:MAG: hypothetical protein GX915_07990 [Clostridiales bacterium]|nr:hypothetical protein [Clostridiales bacterium]
MFGYVNIYKAELKMKHYDKYKAYYCGLCRTLKKKYSPLGQLTLSYDMTFLVILLTSLYEDPMQLSKHRCIAHPTKKRSMLQNDISEYVADMNIALTYYHLLDDWQDEKSIIGLTGSTLLKGYYKRIRKEYPRQCKAIEKGLKTLRDCEERNEANIDVVSRCFGEMMAEVFDYKEDLWGEGLRKIGFYLGKFIYIMDAYDDLEEDIEKKQYNPLVEMSKDKDFDEKVKAMLTLVLSESTAEFEMLPCLIDVEILRNILYEGVWSKYLNKQKEKVANKGQ